MLLPKMTGAYTIQTETPLSPTEKSTLGLIIDSYENGSHEKPVVIYKTTSKNNLNLEIVFSILTTLYFLITSLRLIRDERSNNGKNIKCFRNGMLCSSS
ncbi:hypothetical protein MX850_06765 [Erysipelothrix sp. Poltava]|nr:hypothetical protein MX850_06765 [Erysipelothrix sp. Poltava]